MKLPRYSAVELLGALILLMLTAPFVADLPHGNDIEVGILTLVMVSAVVALGVNRQSKIYATMLVVPAVVTKWLNHFWPEHFSPLLHIITGTVFFLFVVIHLLQFILRAPRVDANVLCAGISGYLLLGLLWVPAYLIVARLNPASFALTAGADANGTMDGFHCFYFSFITLCTVGYGDVTPVSKVARTLAIVEAIAGLFYVAVVISRLVSLHSTQPASSTVKPEPPETTNS